jgi:hypothetical protein
MHADGWDDMIYAPGPYSSGHGTPPRYMGTTLLATLLGMLAAMILMGWLLR